MNFHGYLALVSKRNRIDCYSKPKWNRKLKRCCRIAYTDFKEQRKELTTNQCSVQNCHAKKITWLWQQKMFSMSSPILGHKNFSLPSEHASGILFEVAIFILG